MPLSAMLLAVPLAYLSVSDLRHRMIPDLAVVTVALFGLIGTSQKFGLPTAVIETGFAIATCAVFWGLGAVYWRRAGGEALGIGDAKLIGAGVLVCGITNLWLLLLLASLGGIVSTLLARWWRGKVEEGVAFGPYLAMAIFLVFWMDV